jgi:transposase
VASDLERIHQRKKAADRELTAALKTAGTTLTALEGTGPSGAVRLLVEAGDIARFPRFIDGNRPGSLDSRL